MVLGRRLIPALSGGPHSFLGDGPSVPLMSPAETEGLSLARGDAMVPRARELQPRSSARPVPAWLGQLRCLMPRSLPSPPVKDQDPPGPGRHLWTFMAQPVLPLPSRGVTQLLRPVTPRTSFSVLLEFQGFHRLLDPSFTP